MRWRRRWVSAWPGEGAMADLREARAAVNRAIVAANSARTRVQPVLRKEAMAAADAYVIAALDDLAESMELGLGDEHRQAASIVRYLMSGIRESIAEGRA